MDKFEILELLENTGVDVAAELVGAMSDAQADDLLGYIARMWDIDLDEDEDEDEDETAPRYANPEIQAAYEWACEWVCDSTTAAHICDQCDAYGTSASFWHSAVMSGSPMLAKGSLSRQSVQVGKYTGGR